MSPARDLDLLRQSAAALRARGETSAADEVDRAIRRLEGIPTHRADLDSVARGVFRLRNADEQPKPRPPKRAPVVDDVVDTDHD